MKLTNKEKAMGKWVKVGKYGKALIEPSQEYIDANTPSQEELDANANEIILQEIKNEQQDLLRLVEDMAIFLDTMGFVIPKKQKDRIESIKIKRVKLK